MLSLLGDRFLKWFTGDCKRTLRLPTTKTEEQNIEPEADKIVEPDNHTAEDDAVLPITTNPLIQPRNRK